MGLQVSLHAKIAKLKRLAASTTFPEEKATALAKAAKLRDQLNLEAVATAPNQVSQCPHTTLNGLSGVCLRCGANVWDKHHGPFAQQAAASKPTTDGALVAQAQELKPWLKNLDEKMADQFQLRLIRYGSLSTKQRKWLGNIIERGWAARERQTNA